VEARKESSRGYCGVYFKNEEENDVERDA